jgi:hypothetical protein
MSNTKTSRSRRKVPGPVLEYENGIPVVPVIAKQSRKGTLLQLLACPYCGELHIHGGGESGDDPRDHEGHRVAHCLEPDDRGYILRVVGFEPPTS